MKDDFAKQIDNAYNLHVNAKYEEAKAEYEKLLQTEPDNIELRNLYASLNFALGNYDIALEYFFDLYKELKLDDTALNIIKIYLKKKEYQNAADFAANITNKTPGIIRAAASANFKLNNYDLAKDLYLRLINDNHADLSDIFNLSLAYLKEGDYETSLKYAMKVYAKRPEDYDVILHIISIYTMLKDTDNRLKYLIEAVNIKPDADMYTKIGFIYKNKKDLTKALEYCQKALDINPEDKNALYCFAELYENYDKHVALERYEELYFRYPKDKMILFKLFYINMALTDYHAASAAVKELIEINPEEPVYYIFQAELLRLLGKYEDAIIIYQTAKEKGAEKDFCDLNTANVYSIMNKRDKVQEILNNVEPKDKNETALYAILRYKEKNFQKGRDAMHEYLSSPITENEISEKAVNLFYRFNINKSYDINEADFKIIKKDWAKKFGKKLKYYTKKDLYKQNPDNKRIFIYNNNGIGDIIMFSRYINILGNYTKNITLSVPKSISGLMKTSFPQYTIIQDNDYPYDEKNYDYTTNFYELIVCTEETLLKDIPFSNGYLSVENSLIKEKQAFEFIKTKKKKVGIFWQGNPEIMPQRHLRLKEMLSLFEITDIQYYSFQISDIDNDSEELKKQLPLIDLKPYIKDYSDTAAFLKNIDVLVTIDTSIANLAGALGVKTFLMLPYDADWRWFYDTETTPWYDSIRIFKQSIPSDWSDVIKRIKQELTKL